MAYEKYQVFCKVVELGSLSHAAEALGYTQSGISRMIQSLEKEFGLSLLIRNKAGVSMTENGKIVLKKIEVVLDAESELKNAVAEINGLKIGTLRIGTFPSVAVEWLPEVIRIFQNKYPGIKIQLVDGDHREIEQWLLDGKIDFGFLTETGNLKIEFIPLHQDEMLAVLPKSHPLADLESFPVTQYSVEPFIFPHKGLDTDVRALLKHARVNPNIKYDVRGGDSIIAMVRNKLGIGLFPELYLKAHSGGILIKHLSPRYYRIIGIGFSSHSTNKMIADKFIYELKVSLNHKYGKNFNLVY